MSTQAAVVQPNDNIFQSLRRWISRWKTFSLGIGITVIFFGCTLLAPWIAPYPVDKANYAINFSPPTWQHIMGTDEYGRDIFTRILYGGQVSLYVGILSVVIANVIGMPLGLMIGFFGGRFDTIISRIVDAFFAFPSILWAISIVAILGPSATSAMVALAISRIPITVRAARSAMISAKEKEYVEASKALGSSWAFIIFRSILPNCAGPLVVLFSLGFPVSIINEAGLSYLGLSAQPPTPSWGNLLQDSQHYLSTSFWYALFPGITLFLVVLGLNLVGDGMRDLFDPRHNRKQS